MATLPLPRLKKRTMSLPVNVQFIKTHKYARLPTQGSQGAAGFDIYAAEDGIIPPRQRGLVNTGLRISVPEGYEAQVRSRSGLALKHGICVLNSPGTIDEDYRGALGVILLNTELTPFHVKRGDRIAQLVLRPVVQHVRMVFTDEFTETERGEDGYGSTGGF